MLHSVCLLGCGSICTFIIIIIIAWGFRFVWGIYILLNLGWID